MKYSTINSSLLGVQVLSSTDFNISKSGAIAKYGPILCSCGINLEIIKGRNVNDKFQIRAREVHKVGCIHSAVERIARNPEIEISRIFSSGSTPPANNTTQTTNSSTDGTAAIVASNASKKSALISILSDPSMLHDFKNKKVVVSIGSKIDMSDPAWTSKTSAIIEVDATIFPGLNTYGLSHYTTGNIGAKSYNDYIRGSDGTTLNTTKASIKNYRVANGAKEYYFVRMAHTTSTAIEYMKIIYIEYITTI